MSRRLAAVLIGAALAAGCSHTQRVAPERKSADEEARSGERVRADAQRRPDEGEGARAVPRDRTRPPVPAAPAGLLADGAGAQVKQALEKRGLLARAAPGDALDDAASAALRRFQQEQGLAATGFPDRETLRRLGLEPKDVYRKADETR